MLQGWQHAKKLKITITRGRPDMENSYKTATKQLKICNSINVQQHRRFCHAISLYPSAAANGHPTKAPSAVKKTAPGMLPMYQQPTAIIVVFIANELGRNAVDDVNIPAANTSAASVSRPVFTPNCRQMALKQHI